MKAFLAWHCPTVCAALALFLEVLGAMIGLGHGWDPLATVGVFVALALLTIALWLAYILYRNIMRGE